MSLANNLETLSDEVLGHLAETDDGILFPQSVLSEASNIISAIDDSDTMYRIVVEFVGLATYVKEQTQSDAAAVQLLEMVDRACVNEAKNLTQKANDRLASRARDFSYQFSAVTAHAETPKVDPTIKIKIGRTISG